MNNGVTDMLWVIISFFIGIFLGFILGTAAAQDPEHYSQSVFFTIIKNLRDCWAEHGKLLHDYLENKKPEDEEELKKSLSSFDFWLGELNFLLINYKKIGRDD